MTFGSAWRPDQHHIIFEPRPTKHAKPHNISFSSNQLSRCQENQFPLPKETTLQGTAGGQQLKEDILRRRKAPTAFWIW